MVDGLGCTSSHINIKFKSVDLEAIVRLHMGMNVKNFFFKVTLSRFVNNIKRNLAKFTIIMNKMCWIQTNNLPAICTDCIFIIVMIGYEGLVQGCLFSTESGTWFIESELCFDIVIFKNGCWWIKSSCCCCIVLFLTKAE
jgi:hypothetical protein